MYVDKTVSGIRAVQTLSRLNRAHAGKHDVFVLDFLNDAETISEAFSKYYRTTILSDETDPNKLHDLQGDLDGAQVYSPARVTAFVKRYLDGVERERLDPILDQCVSVYVNDLGEDEQVAFKSKAKGFARTYAFLSSVLPYNNPGWEERSIFLNFLIPKLPSPIEDDLSKGILEKIDMDSYRAEKQAMRKIIDTYIEADEPREISPFDNMGLLELIVKTGIADAIASQLGGLKGNRNAIAETIENNVRSKIIKEHLSDPAFYEKMSALLDEIITERKAKAVEYEEYLKRIAELAQRVEAGLAEDTPEPLKNSPALRALYNNLKRDGGPETPGEDAVSEDPALDLALKLDAEVKRVRPDGWRGVQAREQVIKAALYQVLEDEAEVERIFLIIRAQDEY